MNTRQDFEQWYVENAFDYVNNPVGSRDCGLQWKSWQAATARQDAKVKALVEALEGVAMMARCGQLDKFIGEPWLNAVHKALAAKEPEFSYAPRGITE